MQRTVSVEKRWSLQNHAADLPFAALGAARGLLFMDALERFADIAARAALKVVDRHDYAPQS
jgi:hypothetical protein